MQIVFQDPFGSLDARMRVEQERMLSTMKPDDVPAAFRDALRQALRPWQPAPRG